MSFPQQKEYQLSTYNLNISEGVPAGGMKIKLETMNPGSGHRKVISGKKIMENARVNDFSPSSEENKGICRFTFYTEPYFKENNRERFYPFIEVVFEITGDKHFHVSITLSAFGYSAYPGN
ncbi:hydroxyisourate hydrolase [Salegentibacter echinorum]|uniref:hydroxyisourate hydrolase n=1 Tax=Salegentibacter echinorum TaxID=1073325 RepID=UPI001FEBAF49|nr:hydroxyisourate hydrolase [Salegentibacter echinorum]